MGFSNYIRECFGNHKSQIIFFYEFFGVPSGIFSLLTSFIFKTPPIFLIIYYIIILVIILGAPFIYYTKDYQTIDIINKKNVPHTRDGAKLFKFEIITYSDTKSEFHIRVGSQIKYYYLLFLKFPDIEMNFSRPNEKFIQTERRNDNYYVIKCKENLTKEFFLTVNTVNKDKKSSIKIFKIWYSKESSFNNSMKKKRIFKGKILCAP